MATPGDHQQNAYRQAQPEWWLEQGLPYQITNNAHIAHFYAQAIYHWHRDHPSINHLHILEIGCGLGLLAHYLVDQLITLQRLQNIPSWHYTLSDLRNHHPLELCPRLKQASQNGLMDWQMLDLTDASALEPYLNSTEDTGLIVIANYVVDSLPYCTYHRNNHQIICLDDEKSIQNRTNRVEGEAHLPHHWHESSTHHDRQTRILCPSWYHALDTLCHQTKPTLILNTDKGWAAPVDAGDDWPNYVIAHSQGIQKIYSVPVDFDYYQRCWQSWGGQSHNVLHGPNLLTQLSHNHHSKGHLASWCCHHPGMAPWLYGPGQHCFTPANTSAGLYQDLDHWLNDAQTAAIWAETTNSWTANNEDEKASLQAMAHTLADLPWFAYRDRTMGKLYAKAGLHHEAVTAFTTSLGWVNQRQTEHLWLHVLYELMGQTAEADHYRKLIEQTWQDTDNLNQIILQLRESLTH